MRRDALFVVGDVKQIEDRARKLILSTLAPVQSDIAMITVKILPDDVGPLPALGFGVSMSAKMLAGNTLRSEAHDCDEMLAVYKALADLINQVPLEVGGVGNDPSGRVR